MIIAHYAHRLPADYDIDSIRERARGRAPIWDNVPGLYFKAFLLRERGRFGANQNEYSSLYLWRRDEGFRDFLVDGRIKPVTDSFGRPAIETRFVLDAHKGEGKQARFLFKQEREITIDTDLPILRPTTSPMRNCGRRSARRATSNPEIYPGA